MRGGEEVTFGTSGLDRAAILRKETSRLAAALADGAKVLPVWRGKLMMAGTAEAMTLAFRKTGDPVLAKAAEAPILLGLDDAGAPVFAADITPWVPPEMDEAQVNAFLDRSVQIHPSEEKSGAGFHELRGAMTLLSRRDAELAATARALLQWHATHRFCARCGKETTIAQAGWQRDCGACGGHHFPRTDPVVIMLITHGDKVLLGRSPAWPERMFSLLAGFVEPGETMEAAVRREVFEESGVRVGRVDYLASQPWPFPASLMLGCRGEALTTEITLDPVELEDARWISRSELLEVFAGAHPDIAGARKGAIAHFLLERWLSDRLV